MLPTLLRTCPSTTCTDTPPPLAPPDSHAPTWANNLDGQLNLRDLLRRTITYTQADGG